METHVHIHIHNSSVREELDRGVDPATLADIGYGTVSDHHVMDIATPDTVNPDEVLAQRAESIIASEQQREIDANNRRNHLRAVARHTGKARSLEGFQTTSQTTPRYRPGVNAKQFEATQRAKKSLELACGSCALRDTCKIRGNFDKWVEYHPYKDSDGRIIGSHVPRTESRQKFLDRLAENPEADCIPPKKQKTK